MPISKKEVSHVAGLARLAPTEKDLDIYTEQLQRILAHVDKISELDTEGIEPTTSTTPVRGPMREDKVVESLTQDDALANAPEKAKGCFKVPKIIE